MPDKEPDKDKEQGKKPDKVSLARTFGAAVTFAPSLVITALCIMAYAKSGNGWLAFGAVAGALSAIGAGRELYLGTKSSKSDNDDSKNDDKNSKPDDDHAPKP